MSFMGGGAECSTAGNPLSQFQKHVQDDKTLQRDRMVGTGPGAQANGFRSANAPGAQDQYNNFMNAGPTLGQDAMAGGPQLNHPMQQFQGPARASSASPSTWTQDFNNGHSGQQSPFQAPPGAHFSPDEFARFNQMKNMPGNQMPQATNDPAYNQSNMMGQMGYQRPMMGQMGMGYGGMGTGGQMFQPQPMYQQNMRQQEPEGKGKGRLVELDDKEWEEEFNKMQLQDGQVDSELTDKAERELEDMGKPLQSETNDTMVNEEQFFDQFDTEWNNDLMPDFTNGLGDWGRFGDPPVDSYMFEEDNVYRDNPNAFEAGKKIMREGGNLSLAAMAFESAVQKTPDHAEAWVYLGSAQAQNEKETAAIRAMEQALKLDPNNLTALMGLAVSYTNEGYDSTAYRTLERWLSAKYPTILDPKDLHPPAEMGFTDRQQLHDKVTKLFIKAAQLSPDGEHMDPDVQVGLGVLFYGAEEYDKAVDCFQSALHSSELGSTNQQEQVHLLWNRLGATLANSGRSEEAIAAYEQALSLAPNFVRARYNLGVSCININCHQEAACHFLAALDMHKSIEKSGREQFQEALGGGPIDNQQEATLERMTAQNRSSTLYDTLRRVFTQMGRRDLAEKTVAGVDPNVFRPEFDF